MITQHILSDDDEIKIGSILLSEFEKYRGNEKFDRILKEISETLKTPKIFRENAYKKLYDRKTIEDIRQKKISTTILDDWQKTLYSIFSKDVELIHEMDLYMFSRMFYYAVIARNESIGFTPDFCRAPIIYGYFNKQRKKQGDRVPRISQGKSVIHFLAILHSYPQIRIFQNTWCSHSLSRKFRRSRWRPCP